MQISPFQLIFNNNTNQISMINPGAETDFETVEPIFGGQFLKSLYTFKIESIQINLVFNH